MDATSEHVTVSLGDDAYIGEYNDKEKAKVRKSGPSLIRKTIELAQKGRVLAVMVYWDPTHRCHRVAAQLPDGESVPDLNRLVAEALAGRLPEPKAQRKRVLARRGPRTTRADQRRGKTQRSRPPLRRSARTRHARRIEPASDDIYTFREDSEEAPEAESTNGSDSDNGSDNGSDHSGSESAGHGSYDTVPESLFGSIHTSPLSLAPNGNAAVQDTTGCITTVGGTAGCHPPGSVDASAAEGHALESGQPNATVNFGSGPLVNGFGAYMVANQEAALPSVGIARQDGVSSAAATQQSWQPVASGASQPWPGIQAGEAWRRVVRNALGIVDLLLSPESGTMQGELTTPVLQDSWAQKGRVAPCQPRSSYILPFIPSSYAHASGKRILPISMRIHNNSVPFYPLSTSGAMPRQYVYSYSTSTHDPAFALSGGPADLMSTPQRHTSSVYSDAFDLTELTETISHEECEQQADAVAALESEVQQLRRDLRRLRFMADRGQRALHEMANLVMSISQMLAAVRNQCKIEGRKRLANFAVL
ncbi:hypothetical protein NLG97_g3694 [Lecanicillium saksenae]|uniref:Uncharacterized protein n=1 Tax=Lecanicillium saksenae TaxID=468837 RepID=A0ACC1R022_9HYPO|nr:hypothetical protein NLG97_g3694 [Lecanicillium saksenae]